MSQFITDTHPLVWHLTKKSRLSQQATNIFNETDRGLHQILIPGIVLIEMVYLAEKNIVPMPLLYQMLNLLDIPNGSYAVAPLNERVALEMAQNVPWSAIPELADRIIASTSLSLNLPLITKDQQIKLSGLVYTLW